MNKDKTNGKIDLMEVEEIFMKLSGSLEVTQLLLSSALESIEKSRMDYSESLQSAHVAVSSCKRIMGGTLMSCQNLLQSLEWKENE